MTVFDRADGFPSTYDFGGVPERAGAFSREWKLLKILFTKTTDFFDHQVSCNSRYVKSPETPGKSTVAEFFTGT